VVLLPLAIIGWLMPENAKDKAARLAAEETQRKEETIYRNEFGAQAICEQHIKDELKAPATARFGDEITRVNLGGGRYRIQSYVDAQNSFGALIRTKYVCDASTADGEHWTVDAQF
jgi:hypothetical protein